jgi:hypothetical protein
VAKKISGDDQKKFMNMFLGSAGHWNKDIRNFFIQNSKYRFAKTKAII